MCYWYSHTLKSFLHSGNGVQEATGISARILLKWTPDAPEAGSSGLCFLCNLRVGLILHRLCGCPLGYLAFPKLFLRGTIFLYFWLLSNIRYFFTPYGLGMAKKDFLGTPCPKSVVPIKSHAET